MKDLVCNNFNRLMAASELSKREVAKRIKVNENTLQRWKNKESYPELPNIEELAKVLGVSPLEFYKVEREPAKIEKMSVFSKKIASIPDDVYELAQDIPLSDKRWEQVIAILELGAVQSQLASLDKPKS
jgi:transcriptional regulator with XRE-family HTH domain